MRPWRDRKVMLRAGVRQRWVQDIEKQATHAMGGRDVPDQLWP